MATTADGTPYVESSDLVANYPGVSLALANHIDTIGKILQVVRATNGTNSTTTSTSFVDASISVTITPKKNTSAIMLISTCSMEITGSGVDRRATLSITDNSGNAQSGGGFALAGTTNGSINTMQYKTVIAYATPATLSATTYKLRFRVENATTTLTLQNAGHVTGVLFAIELAA
jgi:hypothetical protein